MYGVGIAALLFLVGASADDLAQHSWSKERDSAIEQELRKQLGEMSFEWRADASRGTNELSRLTVFCELEGVAYRAVVEREELPAALRNDAGMARVVGERLGVGIKIAYLEAVGEALRPVLRELPPYRVEVAFREHALDLVLLVVDLGARCGGGEITVTVRRNEIPRAKRGDKAFVRQEFARLAAAKAAAELRLRCGKP